MKTQLGYEITIRFITLGILFMALLIVVCKLMPLTNFSVPIFMWTWGIFNIIGYAAIAYNHKFPEDWRKSVVGTSAIYLMGVALIFTIYIYNFDDKELIPSHKLIWTNFILLLSGAVGGNALFHGLQK